MRWTESELVTPMSFGIIENEKSYWANHFYAVIECLNSQKGLKYSPRRIDGFSLWSLNALRGYLPPNFFNEIHDFLMNWGFQYFLIRFLNQKMSAEIVSEVIFRLGNMYGVTFSTELSQYSFHISGIDSALSIGLRDRFSEVFPLQVGEKQANIDGLISESDICLVLHNPVRNAKVGIFGEIEGVYGNKLRQQTFWNNKQDFCVFNIGVINGKTKKCYIENIEFNGVRKVNLYFEKDHFVVQDFHTVLNWFKQLLSYGHFFNLKSNIEELDYFINLLKTYWFKPACDLLDILSLHIDASNIIDKDNNDSFIITNITA